MTEPTVIDITNEQTVPAPEQDPTAVPLDNGQTLNTLTGHRSGPATSGFTVQDAHRVVLRIELTEDAGEPTLDMLRQFVAATQALDGTVQMTYRRGGYIVEMEARVP